MPFKLTNTGCNDATKINAALNLLEAKITSSKNTTQIPIVSAIPTAVAGVLVLYILSTELNRIRVVFPDGSDHGLYIPFSYL